MKIGDGTIKLGAYENPEDIIRNVLKFTNSSSLTVENKVSEIFGTQGKSRIQSDATIGAMIEDPTSKFNNLLMNSINKDFLRAILINFISGLQNISSKKALIIYFIHQGVHITFGDSFRLKEEFKDKEYDCYDREYKEDLIAKNKIVNDMMDTFLIYNKEESRSAWEDFLSRIKKFSDDEGYPRMSSKQKNDIYMEAQEYTDFFASRDVSNIRRHFRDFFKDRTDEDEFIDAVNKYRGVLNTYYMPTEKELVGYFNIPESTYRDRRDSALALLQTANGADFLKEVTGEF